MQFRETQGWARNGPSAVFAVKYGIVCPTCGKTLYEAYKRKYLLYPVTPQMARDAEYAVMDAAQKELDDLMRTEPAKCRWLMNELDKNICEED